MSLTTFENESISDNESTSKDELAFKLQVCEKKISNLTSQLSLRSAECCGYMLENQSLKAEDQRLKAELQRCKRLIKQKDAAFHQLCEEMAKISRKRSGSF